MNDSTDESPRMPDCRSGDQYSLSPCTCCLAWEKEWHRLQSIVKSLADRVASQSDALSKRAERPASCQPLPEEPANANSEANAKLPSVTKSQRECLKRVANSRRAASGSGSHNVVTALLRKGLLDRHPNADSARTGLGYRLTALGCAVLRKEM